jgi:hypothetical protein
MGTKSGARFSSYFLPVVLCVVAGCQQQMAVQPSYKPLDPDSFFADGRSARPLVEGTVARGHLRTDRQARRPSSAPLTVEL